MTEGGFCVEMIGDVLYVLAGLIGIALVVIVLIDSWRVSLPEDRAIHFGRNSFRKKKEPMYEDDRTINRHFRD